VSAARVNFVSILVCQQTFTTHGIPGNFILVPDKHFGLN
jgi:hypothetical protein